MEILLAIVVTTAVVFFGALISAGNERQRKAIDGLREQLVLWAMQDLRIKREHLARNIRVDDPLGWLNRITSKVYGFDLNLQVVEAFDEPQVLVCASGNGNERVIFTPHSPNDILRFRKEKHNRLSQVAAQNLLLSLSRNAMAYEISTLNSTSLFDLELPIAWNGLTGQRVTLMERMWMYVIS